MGRHRWLLLLPALAGAAAPSTAAARIPVASCSDGGPATATVRPRHDVALGPLALLGGRDWRGARPEAFDGHGYKIPATLAAGTDVTLRVPRRLRGRVGLVFTHAAQDRVERRGVRGADTAVRFRPCSAGRTGWPGGIAVDRRRCATLVLEVAGGGSHRRRLPLGRRCRGA